MRLALNFLYKSPDLKLKFSVQPNYQVSEYRIKTLSEMEWLKNFVFHKLFIGSDFRRT